MNQETLAKDATDLSSSCNPMAATEASPPHLQEEEQVEPLEEEKETKKAAPPAISLRPFELSDVDDYMVWASDDRVSQFCSWDTYTSKNAVLQHMKEDVLPHPWFRAICIDDRPVGFILVTPNSRTDRCRGEVGYVLASDYWGRGIALQALKLVVVTIFEEMPELERLEAVVDVDNAASQRVMEKARFLREGVLRKYFTMKGRTRDAVIYSFLSTDAEPA